MAHLTEKALRIEVAFQGHPEMEVPVTVYGFSPEGKLLAAAPVKAGAAELPLTEEQTARVRLLVAPTLEPETKPTLALIEKIMPYRPVFKYMRGTRQYRLLPIPAELVKIWLRRPVRVRGQVVKDVSVDGTIVPVPVPHARVHVYEVDPIWFPLLRLPTAELYRIRDELILAIKETPELLPDIPALKGPDPVGTLKRLAEPALRETLTNVAGWIREASRIRGLIWPLYRKQEVAVDETDDDGRFDVTFRHFPFSSIYPLRLDLLPDLYFTVESAVGGVMTSVYKEPVSTSTYFNYTGQEVTIRLTDPRVEVYPPPTFLAGREVAVVTIGNSINIGAILNGETDGRPFGGSVEPHVIFGEELATTGAHYRWSYRKHSTAEPWRVMDAAVIRHYMESLPDGGAVIKAVPLGPVTLAGVGSAFQVQTLTPPAGVWAPAVNARLNTASAFFLTHTLEGGRPEIAAGLYDLKLELFESDGRPAGVAFKVPAATAAVVPEELVEPAEDQIILDEHGRAVAFQMTIRVDNNPCVAEILPVTVGGAEPDVCGFLTYAIAPGVPIPEAVIRFKAYHPNGYARFDFDASRGRTPMEEVIGKVTDTSVTVPHVTTVADGVTGTLMNAHTYMKGADGIFTTSIPASQLLGPCGHAAYATMLHVWATATDGWGRLYSLDKVAVPIGFAIEPS